MTRYFVYALIDPLDGAVRYVGCTANPEARWRQHLQEAKKGQSAKQKWMRTLLDLGVEPEMRKLGNSFSSADEARSAERDWIARYGSDLLNDLRRGGQGIRLAN